MARTAPFRAGRSAESGNRSAIHAAATQESRAALNARNLVVHHGQYYESKKADDEDLWAHVTVVREVVARFLFTIIGYRGDYCSYVGRPHDAKFPPP